MQTISPKTQKSIKAELNRSEKIVWSSTANPIKLAKAMIPGVIFGIAWIVFIIYLMDEQDGFRLPDFGSSSWSLSLPLIGLPFFLIGFLMICSPFWAARKARSTAYIVTNERAIIFEPTLSGGISIRSFLPHQLSGIRRIQLSDGSGDLILGTEITTDDEGLRSTRYVGFFSILDVKKVEAIVFSLVHGTAYVG